MTKIEKNFKSIQRINILKNKFNGRKFTSKDASKILNVNIHVATGNLKNWTDRKIIDRTWDSKLKVWLYTIPQNIQPCTSLKTIILNIIKTKDKMLSFREICEIIAKKWSYTGGSISASLYQLTKQKKIERWKELDSTLQKDIYKYCMPNKNKAVLPLKNNKISYSSLIEEYIKTTNGYFTCKDIYNHFNKKITMSCITSKIFRLAEKGKILRNNTSHGYYKYIKTNKILSLKTKVKDKKVKYNESKKIKELKNIIKQYEDKEKKQEIEKHMLEKKIKQLLLICDLMENTDLSHRLLCFREGVRMKWPSAWEEWDLIIRQFEDIK